MKERLGEHVTVYSATEDALHRSLTAHTSGDAGNFIKLVLRYPAQGDVVLEFPKLSRLGDLPDYVINDRKIGSALEFSTDMRIIVDDYMESKIPHVFERGETIDRELVRQVTNVGCKMM